MPRSNRPPVACPVCGGNHHVLECGAPAPKIVAPVNAFCARCGVPLEFVGPYCIDCTIDRAIARFLGKDV